MSAENNLIDLDEYKFNYLRHSESPHLCKAYKKIALEIKKYPELWDGLRYHNSWEKVSQATNFTIDSIISHFKSIRSGLLKSLKGQEKAKKFRIEKRKFFVQDDFHYLVDYFYTTNASLNDIMNERKDKMVVRNEKKDETMSSGDFSNIEFIIDESGESDESPTKRARIDDLPTITIEDFIQNKIQALLGERFKNEGQQFVDQNQPSSAIANPAHRLAENAAVRVAQHVYNLPRVTGVSEPNDGDSTQNQQTKVCYTPLEEYAILTRFLVKSNNSDPDTRFLMYTLLNELCRIGET